MDTLLMAQQLQNITVQAPGFAGINSQDSPVSIDQSFAATASNCIIDEYGRIGARKGYTEQSSNVAFATDSRGVEAVFESLDASGDKVVFSAADNKIYKGLDFSVTDITPAGSTPAISANNWKIVSFNNHTYFYQREHEPLIYTDSSGSGVLAKHSDFANQTTPPQANEVIGAYGRLWAADVSGNTKTVYWSDTLQGHKWSGGTAGSLDLTTVFPTGHDEIVALSAHNGFLVIFCKRSIIIYSGAESPANMVLHDTVEGVGCIARDSVQHTGTDIIFLSEDGLRSFGRTIQEKSMPMRDLSNNVRTELTLAVRQQTNPIKSIYSADEAFYLLSLQDSQTVYCFDMRNTLPDGANRVTTWGGVNPRSLALLQDGSLYFGREDGIFKYEGYQDNGNAYEMIYYSNPMNFGNSTNLKFLKKFNITIIGNVASPTTLVWGYDYTGNYTKKTFGTSLDNTPISEYNSAQFGDNTTTLIAPSSTGLYLGAFSSAPTTDVVNALYYNTTESKLYYWSGSAWVEETTVDSAYIASKFTEGTDIQRPSVNTSGSGTVVTIGIESTINGAPYSIQQIDVHALLGRLI
ncbi:hypothetical protein N9232_00480 [Akkermansiaceae bacterium]|nr:hypothetical protein [Akkermansiaceae bacterium]